MGGFAYLSFSFMLNKFQFNNLFFKTGKLSFWLLIFYFLIFYLVLILDFGFHSQNWVVNYFGHLIERSDLLIISIVFFYFILFSY